VKETTLKSDVFDQLQKAMAADPAGFTELYRDYLADAWQSLQSLRDSMQQGQAESVRAKAHYLKSSSLVLGARHVARYAALLEEAATTSDMKDASSVLQEVQDALRDVQAELKQRMGAAVVPAGETAA
jgi:HPt (histidine-containing phosphotransfer) domain-containing protein